MMLAGRLVGTADGRPVVIDADECGIGVTVTSLAAAWASRRSVAAVLPLLGILKNCGVPLRLNIAGFVTVELLPKPGALARILAPRLSSLT